MKLEVQDHSLFQIQILSVDSLNVNSFFIKCMEKSEAREMQPVV